MRRVIHLRQEVEAPWRDAMELVDDCASWIRGIKCGLGYVFCAGSQANEEKS